MPFPVFTSRSKLAMFAKAAQVRAGRLGTRGALMGLGSVDSDFEATFGTDVSVDGNLPESAASSAPAGDYVGSDGTTIISKGGGSPSIRDVVSGGESSYGYKSFDSGNAVFSQNRISSATAANSGEVAVTHDSGSDFGQQAGNFLSNVFKGVVGAVTAGTPSKPPPPKPTFPWGWLVVGGIAVVAGGSILAVVFKKK